MQPPTWHPANLLAGQTFAENRPTHQILIGRVQVSLLLHLLAEVAQDLHGAQVRDVRSRRVGQPTILVDDHVVDTVCRKQRGAGGASRPRSDDEYVRGYFIHSTPPIVMHSCLAVSV